MVTDSPTFSHAPSRPPPLPSLFIPEPMMSPSLPPPTPTAATAHVSRLQPHVNTREAWAFLWVPLLSLSAWSARPLPVSVEPGYSLSLLYSFYRARLSTPASTVFWITSVQADRR